MKNCWISLWSACGTAWIASRPWSCATLPGASPRWRKLREGCRSHPSGEDMWGRWRSCVVITSTIIDSILLILFHKFSQWISQMCSDTRRYCYIYCYVYIHIYWYIDILRSIYQDSIGMLCVAANPTGPHAGDCQQRGREGEGDESAGPWRCQRAPHVRLTCASRALHVRFAWSGVLWVPNSTVKSTVK